MNNRFFIRQVLALSLLHVVGMLCASPAFAQSELRQPESTPILFEGLVNSPGGTPAAGAVVVTSGGGQAVTDADGRFRLEANLLRESESVQVTAVGGAGGKLVASQQVGVAGAMGAVSVAPLQLATSSSCIPSWLPTFGGAPGTDNDVYALTVFDDGSGPALFVGGAFGFAGGLEASGMAKWDGSSWQPVGTNMNAILVSALTVFDDGGGPALYAGGFGLSVDIVNGGAMAKWDGLNWTSLGVDGDVKALAVFDAGSGAELYAGGELFFAGGGLVSNVAKWNGSSWSSPGGGVSNTVRALAVFNDGGGPALYSGGDFTPGQNRLRIIQKWNGTSWTLLNSGVDGSVFALTVFDDGSGPALFVGGEFTTAGVTAARNLAKWDGSNWTALGSGADFHVRSLAIFDDGGGDGLFVGGGNLTNASGVPTRQIAKWNGLTWSALGSGVTDYHTFAHPTVHALTVFDDGNGPALFAGGDFWTAGSMAANHAAKWNGSTWAALGAGVSDRVLALAVFDDGSGTALYAGGQFTAVGGVAASRIAKWNGSTWAPLGSGLGAGSTVIGAGSNFLIQVAALAVFDDGSGNKLHVGGSFSTAGGVTANSIAKWDGSSWTPLGSGIGGQVFSLAVFDDGSGASLVAGGTFLSAGGLPASRIAKWNGLSWTPLGTGMDGSVVRALTVFDDGNGDRLFAGGSFQDAGGTPASRIAKWDGSSWTALGNGVNRTVFCLAVFDDGTGDAIFAGGDFTSSSGVSVSHVGKWNGSDWIALATGLWTPNLTSTVTSLTVFDDGQGERLIVGGSFTRAGGTTELNRIAKWDGANWERLGNGIAGQASGFGQAGWPLTTRVDSMAAFNDGSGDKLFAGGSFPSAADSHDSYLAVWGCSKELTTDFCNGDGGDQLGCTNCPCGNNAVPGTIGGCLNSALTSSRLIASGSLSVSLPGNSIDDLRFSLTGAPPNAFCTLNSGDAAAPNNPVNSCFGLGSGVRAMQFDGLRCAVANTRRHGGRGASANGSVGESTPAWGGSDNPPIGIAHAGGGFAAGQTRYFQVIHREDSSLSCMRGLNTSQAIEVTFTP